LLDVFICQCRLKGATMQVQLDGIGSGEGMLREIGEEEFVDDARTRDAYGTFLLPSWMGGHHRAAEWSIWPDRHVRTIVEAADELAFRPLLELIGGKCRRA